MKLSDDTVEVSIPVTSRQTVKLEADVRNIPDSFASNRITIDRQKLKLPATVKRSQSTRP